MKFSRFAALLVAGWLMLPAIAVAGAAAAGAPVFRMQCGACHATEAGATKVGPSLFGLIGRKAGSVQGFHYSAANQNSNITWTEDVLDKYITNPRAVIPGTTMPYIGLKNDTLRENLIAYLATLK